MIKKIWNDPVWSKVIAAVIISLLGLVLALFRTSNLLFVVLQVTVIVIAAMGCAISILWISQRQLSLIATSEGGYYYGPTKRRLLLSLSLIPLLFGCYGVWYVIPRGVQPFKADEVGILIAPVPSDPLAQSSYEQAIRTTIANAGGSLREKVKIRLLKDHLPEDADTQHRAALAIAERLRAALVIRAILVRGGHQVWMTRAPSSGFGSGEYSVGFISTAQLDQPDRLQLSQDVHLLARCTLALLYYQTEQNEKAAAEFEKVLNAPQWPELAPERAAVRLMRANTWVKDRGSERVNRAISELEALLEIWRGTSSQLWAATQNNLGAAYVILPTGDRSTNIARAIKAFESALKERTNRDLSVGWAIAQNNLGAAYAIQPAGNRENNINRAIDAFQQSLRLYTRRDFPRDWALVHSNLGAAYLKHPSTNRTQNVQRAIEEYEKSASVLSQQTFPIPWASTQVGLSIAYSELPSGDLARNMRRSVELARSALEVLSRERDPFLWASIQLNLGKAYERGGSEDDLQRAIECYKAALEVHTMDRFPTDWAEAQYYQGNAYRKLSSTRNRAENISRAIAAYRKALEVRRRDHLPFEWASTQVGLGIAYAESPAGDQNSNLLLGIEAFKRALDVTSKDHSPIEWAATHHNLGTAFSKLTAGNRAENLAQAIIAYRSALEIRNRDNFPVDWANSQYRFVLASEALARVRGRAPDASLALTLDAIVVEYKKSGMTAEIPKVERCS